MPISTISQTISTIPEAGRRGVDVQTTFVTKQEDFQDHLQGTTVTELNALKTQINTTVSGMNGAVTNVNTKASEADADALSASNSANTATTKAGEASTSAGQASTSATKANQWADNNYNVAVETGKYSAKHWSTVAQNTVNNKVDKDISSYANKATPADADLIPLSDSASGFGIKKLSWANIKATLKTYFDSLYMALSGDQTISGNKTFNERVLVSGDSKLGYITGGSVTQITSKSTAVTLNKSNGRVIMHNAPLAAGAYTSFVVYNTLCNYGNICVPTLIGGVSSVNNYSITTFTRESSLEISIKNQTGATLSEAVEIEFLLLRGNA